MFKKPDEQAGSGLDKPDPKSLLEKVSDGVKAVLPQKPSSEDVRTVDTGNGTIQRLPR